MAQCAGSKDIVGGGAIVLGLLDPSIFSEVDETVDTRRRPWRSLACTEVDTILVAHSSLPKIR